MLDAVKKYATTILLLHLAVLILVVLFVIGAAHQVQVSASDEAQAQAQERLELLADQTSRGLQSQYSSILSDLDVILRDESATIPATAPAPAATQPQFQGRGLLGRGGRGNNGRGRGFVPRVDLSQPVSVNVTTLSTLWRQLKGRVSQIFLVNLTTQRVALTFPESQQNSASANALMRANIEWLRTIKDAQMSSFVSTGTGVTNYHLIAVPTADVGTNLLGNRGGPGNPNNQGGGPNRNFGGPGGGFLPPPASEPIVVASSPATSSPAAAPVPQFAVVVVVPIDRVREEFLDPLNGQQNHEVNATLVNSEGQVLAATNLKAGTNLLEQVSSGARPAFQELITTEHDEPTSTVIETPFVLGGQRTAPQIMASAQLEVPSGRHWTLLISSPLSEAETVVNKVFRRALIWAVLVTVSITAILVSTASFMIRGRIRLERTRHDMLTRELQQARHIQLAWLPDLKSIPAGIEVSAANLPASHISGDFYNWFSLPSLMQKTGVSGDAADVPSGKFALVVGDVTGHGMAAAFLMATTQLLVRMTLSRYQDAGRCLKEVNRQLCAQSGKGFQGQFVTMLVIILDTQRGTMQVASAGHPMPLIESHGKIQPLILEPQLVLGVDPDQDYHAESLPLELNSMLLLYTDGVVEAESPDGAQYGIERLMRSLRSHPGSSPADCIQNVLTDVKHFASTRDLHDDVTVVALKTGR